MRLTFKNAMIFNAGEDPVYKAASALLKLFEAEWAKFSTVQTPVSLEQLDVSVRRRSKGLKRSLGYGVLDDDEDRIGVFRDRVDALVYWSEELSTGTSLAQATAKVTGWRTVAASYDKRLLRLEARDMLSSLEDFCEVDSVCKWLESELKVADESDPREGCAHTIHYVVAELACDSFPFVPLSRLVHQMLSCSKRRALFDIVSRNVARFVCSLECMASLLNNVITHTRGRLQEPALALLDALVSATWNLSSKRGGGSGGGGGGGGSSTTIASWKAVQQVIGVLCSENDALVLRLVALAPGLTETIARSVAEQCALGVTNQMTAACYANEDALSRSRILYQLLARGCVAEGQRFVSNVFATVRKDIYAGCLKVLLRECAALLGAVELSMVAELPLHVAAVSRLLVEYATKLLDAAQVKELVCRVMRESCGVGLRQAHFAAIIASHYFSLCDSFVKRMDALLLLTWTPNPLSGAAMRPLVDKLCGDISLGPPAAQVKSYMFALGSAPSLGWKDWAPERDILLQAMRSSSEDAALEWKRVSAFLANSIVAARLK